MKIKISRPKIILGLMYLLALTSLIIGCKQDTAPQQQSKYKVGQTLYILGEDKCIVEKVISPDDYCGCENTKDFVYKVFYKSTKSGYTRIEIRESYLSPVIDSNKTIRQTFNVYLPQNDKEIYERIDNLDGKLNVLLSRSYKKDM